MVNERRLIYLDELLKFPIRIDHYDKEHGNEHFMYGVEAVMEYAEFLPIVDAVEVVHGRWEVVKGVLTPGGDPLLRCAICKSRESEHLCGIECRTVWNYCPNCGAKMMPQPPKGEV